MTRGRGKFSRGRVSLSQKLGNKDPRNRRASQVDQREVGGDGTAGLTRSGAYGVRFGQDQPFREGENGLEFSHGPGLRVRGGKLELDLAPLLAPMFEMAQDGRIQLRRMDNVADLTDSSGGTAGEEIAAISGSGADSDINDNFATINAKLAALFKLLRDERLMKEV